MKIKFKKIIISIITALFIYFITFKIIKSDPHVSNFIPIFIIRIFSLITGGFLILLAYFKNKNIINSYLFTICLLINLGAIIELLLTKSNNIMFYIIMLTSLLIGLTQLYLLRKQ